MNEILMSNEKNERSKRSGVQSVEVGALVLRALTDADEPMKLTELAESLVMPAAKVHRYLVSLIRSGLVQQSADTSKYDLGPAAFHLGLKGLARFEPLKLAEKKLQFLVDTVGETAALAVWTARGPTMIRVIEARHDFASTIAPTHHCAMTFSATGLVFSTFEIGTRTSAIIKRELEQNRISQRVNSPRTHEDLETLKSQVRAHGFATINDGVGGGFGAVSAPVFDATSQLLMAVTVFGTCNRVEATPESALAHLVANAAKEVSREFGHTFPSN
jgi:DNA-binding IclR family transcriptional regulator